MADAVIVQRALRFAGQRSLIEEYVDVVLEIARLDPADAPTIDLLRDAFAHATAAGMTPMAARLQDAAEQLALMPADLIKLPSNP